MPTELSLVLVIEDDPVVLELMNVILTEAGVPVASASTGEEALKVARARRPSVALIDVHLPGMCGYETCRALREQFGEALAVIFVSGERTESFDRVAGLLLGADDYLTKPFATDELVARVRRLLHRTPTPPRQQTCGLTKRESEILSLLARGMHQSGISTYLRIRPKTVGTHIEHILFKLGVQSRAQAVGVAYRDGLIEPTIPCDLTPSSSTQARPDAVPQPPLLRSTVPED